MSTPGRPPIPPPPIAGTTSSSSARFPSPPAERPPPQPHPHSSSSPDPLANSDDSIHTLSSVTSLSSAASGATTSSSSSFEQFTATPLGGVGVGSGTGKGKGAPTQNPYAGLKFSASGTLGGEKEATEDPLAMANRFERLGLGIGAGSFTLPYSEGRGMGHASGSGSPSPSSAGTTRPSLPAIVTTSMQTRGVEAPSPVESPVGMRVSSSPSPAPSPVSHHFLPPHPSHSSLPAGSAARHHPRSSLSSLSPRSATSPPNVQSSATVSNGMTRASSSSTSSSSAPSSRPLSAASPTGGGKSSTSRPSSRSGSGSATPATATSGSSRPWVFDSDASSVCSGHSGSGVGAGGAAPPAASSTTGGGGGGGTSGYASSSSSGGQEQAMGKRRVIVNEDGTEEVVDEGGKVFKAPGDMEFLDHRPEPPGVSLSFDRSSPSQLLILVTLPGFSLENITVAMKRSHKLHIVADAYGENGGHYERLLGLGSDISTAAPRAEFDGTVLRVYVQRRPSRPSSAASVAGSTPAPFGLPGIGGGYGMPFAGASSPPNGGPSPFSSPEMDHTRRPSIASSLASVWSDASTGSSSQAHYPPLSPSLEPHHHHHHFASTSTSSPFDPSLFLASSTSTSSVPLDPPHTAHAPPSPLPGCSSTHAQKRSKSLIGPEGARAAAKAAKEELAKRAKEEAGRLPEGARGGRWFPFKDKDKVKKGAVLGDGASGSGCASGNSSSSEVSSTFSSASSASLSGSGSGGSGTDATETSGSEASPPLEKALDAAELERNNTIKASSARSPSPRPPPLLSAHSSGGSSSTTIAATAATSSSASAPAPEPATRPKLRSNNLTLRPLPHSSDQSPSSSSSTASSVFGAAASTEGKSPSGSAGSDGGGVTPRWEVGGMSFTPAS